MTVEGREVRGRGGRLPAAAIWDMDGLLFDTIPLHIECWRLICEEEGLSCDLGAIRRVCGCHDLDIGKVLLGEQVEGITQRRIEELVARKQALFTERLPGSIRLHAGVQDWLDHFAAAGYGQAVASSAARHDIELAISSADLTAYFQIVVSAQADVNRGKPAPDIFLLASERLGVTAARCVVLEDAEVGVRAAKAAGMRCVAVTNTQSAEVLRDADLVVASLADASPAICDDWLGLL